MKANRISQYQAEIAGVILMLALLAGTSIPVFAGFNADSPAGARRIFTQLAFARGRLVSYHVLEPGPPPGTLAGQSFPTDDKIGVIIRFPRCVGMGPVLDDTAAPSSATNLVLDRASRAVLDSNYANCAVQPKSLAQVTAATSEIFDPELATKFVNAASVPAPIGANVPTNQQQSADSLWGPVPNVPSTLPPGVNPAAAFPQPLQGTTQSGINIGTVAQPSLRRPRIQGFAAGQEVWFITYETSGRLTSPDIEAQWQGTRFPDAADLFFLAYGRAPLPASITNTQPNTATEQRPAVLNVVGGAPNNLNAQLTLRPGAYSPIWEMFCFNGGFRPLIGPGTDAVPCGATRFSQVGQPRTPDDVRALATAGVGQIIGGIFVAINCPIPAVDFNDDGGFQPNELITFPDLDWDFDGVPDGTLN